MVIPAVKVHQWHALKSLLENIQPEFLQRPETLRGEHFIWLLTNEHVLAELDRGKRAGESER